MKNVQITRGLTGKNEGVIVSPRIGHDHVTQSYVWI